MFFAIMPVKITPFDGVPQRACEDGPLCTRHNLHCTARSHLNK